MEQDTIAKRIYRAREKMRNGSVELEPPHGIHLTQRLDVVLKTLYLLFNEGYYSSRADDRLVREDLCREAMRLCQLLCEHRSTALPRTHALLALFSFQASRLHARLDDNGHIILLKYQDRTQWNRALIRAGFEQLERAAEPFEVTAYHLEAAIASVHAASPSFEKTDWTSIHHLYEMLYQLQPNPIVAMNKAIASSFAISNRHALSELQTIRGLEHHHLYLATLGEICLAMQEYEEARGYFEKASAHAPTVAEKQLLFARVTQCRAN